MENDVWKMCCGTKQSGRQNDQKIERNVRAWVQICRNSKDDSIAVIHW